MRISLKKIGLFSSGLLVNGYLLSEAYKANQKSNTFLAKLSPEDLEARRARDWYIKKNGGFIESGFALLETLPLRSYNALPQAKRDDILAQYRREVGHLQIKARWEEDKIDTASRQADKKL